MSNYVSTTLQVKESVDITARILDYKYEPFAIFTVAIKVDNNAHETVMHFDKESDFRGFCKTHNVPVEDSRAKKV